MKDEETQAKLYADELREIAGMLAQLPDGPARWKQYRLVAIADFLSSQETATDHLAAIKASEERPVDMLLFCPKCGVQHVDAPGGEWDGKSWDNPPHRSHLCHSCGCVWRPADVATNGVASIATSGTADTWSPADGVASEKLSIPNQPSSESYLPSLEQVQAEMLAVAVAGGESDLADEWPVDCRAQVDIWQAGLQVAIAASEERATLAERRVAKLEGAVRRAQKVFDTYAQMHRGKHTEEGEAKAIVNELLAEEMGDAIRNQPKGEG